MLSARTLLIDLRSASDVKLDHMFREKKLLKKKTPIVLSSKLLITDKLDPEKTNIKLEINTDLYIEVSLIELLVPQPINT